MVANTPGKHFRLNNPTHLTGLIVSGRPSDRLEFITRENCLRVISSQFRANQPGCIIFPSCHLEAGSADEDRNLRSMHVDYQLLSHPSPSPLSRKNHNPGKAPCPLDTYPQMLWTVGLVARKRRPDASVGSA